MSCGTGKIFLQRSIRVYSLQFSIYLVFINIKIQYVSVWTINIIAGMQVPDTS